MTVSHAASARAAATDAVTALLGTNARLKFHPTGATLAVPGTVLANLPLTATANGGFSTGGATATAGAITSDTAAVAGTVAAATLQTSGSVAIILCAVAASGSDINMSNGLVLATNDTVSCSSLTYTALPQ
jgi:hypothetical protein